MDGLTIGRADGELIARNMAREAKAHALIEAVLDCDPADRLPFLEAIVDGLRAGMPIPLFGKLKDEANFWAERASRAEKKVYGAACYTHLEPEDQAAFRAYTETRRAA